jgi:DNA-binding NarL/FixJ family response regulator
MPAINELQPQGGCVEVDENSLNHQNIFDRPDFVSQEESASQSGLAQHLDGRVLISCRENPNSPEAKEEAAKLRLLSAREYEVLYGKTCGLSHATLGEILGLSTNTVRTHLGEIFDKISPRVRSSEEVATFIPMDERDVYAMSFYRIRPDGFLEDKLSPAQQKVCDLQIAGLTRQEIALEKGLSDSTVRTHMHGIYKALGISGTEIDRPGLVLRRLAVASKNLNAYHKTIEKLASSLQPIVSCMIQESETGEFEDRVNRLLRDPASRPKLLRPLITRGYVELGNTSPGKGLGLDGIIAAILILDRRYQEVMLHGQTAPIAKVVIGKEVEYQNKNSN